MKNDKILENTLFVFDATEGMVLSKDVVTPDGYLIAAKDTVLTLDIISKISYYNILKINIYDPAAEEQPADGEELTYYEKVRKSEAFEKFSEAFIDNVNHLKSNLNAIVINNAPIDTDTLLKNTEKILNEYTNSLQILDMLHSMRDKDDITYTHSVNVAIIASIIGKWLNYSQEDISILILCGLLHDIGKLLVPNEILNKPDRLTINEYSIIKEHSNLGYQVIKDTNMDERIKSAVLLHHEKCDGSGYPFGYTREQIPDFAKIITIADIYDAMTSARVYRSAICPFTVIKIMNEEAFTKYEPAFIIPFLKYVVTSYIGNNVKLSDGRIGEVVMINEHAIDRPVVRCGKDDFVDLSESHNHTIEITAVL